MKARLSADQARRLRARAQGLGWPTAPAAGDVATIVRDSCGLQAQEQPAAALSVRTRGAGITAESIERARTDERSVVRTWCMRGTLHLVAAEDFRWLMPLLGPVFSQKDRGRRAELGLDDEVLARAMPAFREMLANGPLARPEIVRLMASHGITLEGQAVAHFVGFAALEGMICVGPDEGARATCVLVRDWLGCELSGYGELSSRDEALAELARRYLAAYAPATPLDFSAWSGLPAGDARNAWRMIASEVIEVGIEDNPAWMLESRAAWLAEPDAPEPVVHLLPRFDTYLLGYQGRELTVAPEFGARVNAGGGILHRTVLVDGRVKGGWRAERSRDRLDIFVEPFEPLAHDVKIGIEAEARDVARFFGTSLGKLSFQAG